LEVVNSELTESEKEYRDLIGNPNDAIIVDEPSRYSSLVNPRFCEMTGHSVEETKRFQFSSLVHSDDLAMVEENLRRILAGEGVCGTYQFRGLSKAGKTIYVDYNSGVIEREGRIVGSRAL